MELQVYVSKKGTRVVAATGLHQALQLTDHHYATNVKRWITEVYAFRDDIRRPEKLRDFAPRKAAGPNLLKDYYLSLELARLITLNSKSKVKLKYAKWLLHQEQKEGGAAQWSNAQILKILELTKAMSMLSCQEAAEQQHLKVYEKRNGGQTANWWKYRAQVMGYSAAGLRKKLLAIGHSPAGQTQRQMLLQLDRHELIRTGMIDYFMAMGKPAPFAQAVGDLAKQFARELDVELQDDRQGMASLFAPQANDGIVREIRNYEPQRAAAAWSQAG